MYANDEVGDCTCAAVGHMIDGWQMADAGQAHTFYDTAILRAYRAVSGWDGVPGSDSDRGANMLDVLNYMRNVGLAGRRIGAYVKVDIRDRARVKAAAFLFGGLYVGVQLPEFVQDQDHWSLSVDAPGSREAGSWGGHAVNLVQHTPRVKQVVTWARRLNVTYEFLDRYCDEAYAILSPDWLGKDATAPNGFKLDQLKADLAAL